LLEFINRQNEAWVEATRRLSPGILVALLEWSGRETQAYFESLDLYANGLGVSWAGDESSPAWFDLAREYTERWHHQAQIREAASLPLLCEPRLFAPVLRTFVRALPHTFRDTSAPDGTRVRLTITGEAGDTWSVVRTAGSWSLEEPGGEEADASAEIDQDTAWRVFTKGLSPDEGIERSKLAGDRVLARQVFQTVAIIA
jgi:hypothetical protein